MEKPDAPVAVPSQAQCMPVHRSVRRFFVSVRPLATEVNVWSAEAALVDVLSLGADKAHLVLSAEDVAVQLRNPLLAAHRDV